MSFKEWLELQEVGTSTGSVAGFARISLPMVTRQFVPFWGEGDPFFRKKKKKKKMNESHQGQTEAIQRVIQGIQNYMHYIERQTITSQDIAEMPSSKIREIIKSQGLSPGESFDVRLISMIKSQARHGG